MPTVDTILDRFEEDEAVFLINGSPSNEMRLPIKELPISLKQGDTIRIHKNEEGYLFERMREGDDNKNVRIEELIEEVRMRDKRTK